MDKDKQKKSNPADKYKLDVKSITVTEPKEGEGTEVFPNKWGKNKKSDNGSDLKSKYADKPGRKLVSKETGKVYWKEGATWKVGDGKVESDVTDDALVKKLEAEVTKSED